MIFIATNLHSYVTNNSLDTVAKDMEAVWNCYRFESIHNRIYSIYITTNYIIFWFLLSCRGVSQFCSCWIQFGWKSWGKYSYIVGNTWEYIFSYGSSKKSVRKLRILLGRTAMNYCNDYTDNKVLSIVIAIVSRQFYCKLVCCKCLCECVCVCV